MKTWCTTPDGDATRVTGSTYLFDMQIARFFTTLPPFQLEENLLPPGPAAEGAVA